MGIIVTKFMGIYTYLYLLFELILLLATLALILFIISYIIYLIACLYFFTKYKPRKFGFKNDFYILGHRGIPVLEHENTIESFDLINKFDIDGTEFDVNISLDKKLYVYHDYNLFRLFGIDKNLKETYSENLDNLKIILFSSKIYGNKIESKIPKINEAFEKLKNCRLLNLEIKSNSLKDLGLEKAVAELIKKYELQKKIVISSFDPFCLYRFSKFLPEVPRGLLVSKSGLAKYLKDMWFLAFSKADFIHFESSFIGTPIVKQLKKKGYSIVFWGVNSVQLFERALKDQPIFIISDIPHILKDYYK
ncbi:MAG: glycerophosphodiester phosphodiesterase [Spirochaetales bacterium]|nr:glycerophosphodiester phosphodiesterase [Spirochaetales bacterium]